jgi:hypothetical protein
MENDTPLPKKDEVEPAKNQIKMSFDRRAKYVYRIRLMEKRSVKTPIPKFPGRYTTQTWNRNWTP